MLLDDGGTGLVDDEQPTGNLLSHERICALRYKAINSRLKRIETVLLWLAGVALTGMGSMICGLVFYLLTHRVP